jgi:hypothetical protein
MKHRSGPAATLALLGSLLIVSMAFSSTGAEPAEHPAVVVYYFHGEIRCLTCLQLEDMTVAVVRDSLSDLLGAGILGLEIVNFQEKGNEHFIADFELEHQAVIVAEYQETVVKRWQNLDKIWELHEDPAKFDRYILARTNEFLDAASREP